MIFHNRMLNTVIDRFGKDVMAVPTDEDHFTITVPIAVSQQFYGWVFSLGRSVRIVGPKDVVEGMQAALAKVNGMYPKDDNGEIA